MRVLTDRALDTAARRGSAYADVRIVRRLDGQRTATDAGHPRIDIGAFMVRR